MGTQRLEDVGIIPVRFNREIGQSAGATFGKQSLYVARAIVKGREFSNYGSSKQQAAEGLALWIQEAGYSGRLRLPGGKG